MTSGPDDVPRADLLGLDPKTLDAESGSAEFDALAEFRALEADLERGSSSPFAKLRELATPVRIVLASLASFAAASLVGVTACRADLASVSVARLVAESVLFAVTLVATIALAMRPAHRPELDRPRLAVALGLGLAVAFLVAFFPPPAADVGGFGPIPPPDWTAGLPCLTIGMLVGIPSYLVARALDRGTSRTAYFAASAAGIAGNLALTMHCPLGDVGHRLSSHASLGVLFLVSLGLAAAIEHRFPSGKRP